MEVAEAECIFCTKPAEDDDEANLIVHRGERCFVILNKFPYNPGHLLVVPLRHVGELEDVTSEENAELQVLMQRSLRVIRVGAAQGVAGASTASTLSFVLTWIKPSRTVPAA